MVVALEQVVQQVGDVAARGQVTHSTSCAVGGERGIGGRAVVSELVR